MKISTVVVLLLFLLPVQQPTASIEGVVMGIGTNEPIRDARVALNKTTFDGPGGPLTVTTDAEGRFALRSIDPGTYRIEFAADGYSRMQYGQRVPTGIEGQSGMETGRLVTLGPGQQLQGLAVRLTPTGSISGRLRDANGRPAVDVPVQLLRWVYSDFEGRTFLTVASGQTDDRGEYRLYWVTPGQYFLAAGLIPGPGARILQRQSLGDLSPYPFNLYPGVSDVAAAKALTVEPGAELGGIDLAMGAQKLYRIRGRVTDLRTGKPPATVRLGMSYVGFSGSRGVAPNNSSYNPIDGSFELRDIHPGSYWVTATVQDPAAGNADARPAHVTIERSDVDGILLTAASPVSLSAKISVDRQPFSAVKGLFRMYLTPSIDGKAQPSGMRAPRASAISPEGSMTFDGAVPGEYRLTFQGAALPPGVYVKQATFQEKDALNTPIQISGPDLGTLSVVLGLNPGQIAGTIRDADGRPAAGIRAVLVPDQHRDRTDLYEIANADAAGRFVIRDIAPGDYKLYAWDSIEPYSWYDSDVMKRYEPLGKSIRISEASKESLDLNVIE